MLAIASRRANNFFLKGKISPGLSAPSYAAPSFLRSVHLARGRIHEVGNMFRRARIV